LKARNKEAYYIFLKENLKNNSLQKFTFNQATHSNSMINHNNTMKNRPSEPIMALNMFHNKKSNSQIPNSKKSTHKKLAKKRIN
jgi:hypothetical protein